MWAGVEMNWNDYLDARLQFETDVKSTVPERVSNNTDLLRGLHFVMGMVTEAYELKHYTDSLNLIEEAGDALWFFGGLLAMYGGHDNATLMRFTKTFDKTYTDNITRSVSRTITMDCEDAEPATYGLRYAIELLDMYKAAIFYGRTLDSVAVFNRLIMYYIQLLYDVHVEYWCQNLSSTKVFPIEAIMAVNIAKLSARYSEGYADAKANNRNKEFEREAMQKALEPYL